jgi:hypothetical protein
MSIFFLNDLRDVIFRIIEVLKALNSLEYAIPNVFASSKLCNLFQKLIVVVCLEVLVLWLLENENISNENHENNGNNTAINYCNRSGSDSQLMS